MLWFISLRITIVAKSSRRLDIEEGNGVLYDRVLHDEGSAQIRLIYIGNGEM